MGSAALKKALVTGGAGFIGSHLVDALAATGCRVTVLDNLSTGKRENLAPSADRVELVEGDIRDRDLLLRLAAGCDAIFHLAAVVSVPETVADPYRSSDVNEMGTLSVLEAARHRSVARVVFSSSCAVYGDAPRQPKTEAMPVRPQSPYAVQKLAAEHHLRVYGELYGMHTVSLRYFNVYGPRQDPSSVYSGVISIFLSRAAADDRPVIYGDGEQYRDFVFVGDVVRANLMAAGIDAAAGRVVNIGTGRHVRINRLWEHIAELAGCTAVPEYRSERPGDIRESVADIGRARTVLGFEPAVAVTDGLKETYRWYTTTSGRPS